MTRCQGTVARIAALILPALLLAAPEAWAQQARSTAALVAKQTGVGNSSFDCTSQTIGTTAVQILTNNPARYEVVVVNTGASICEVLSNNQVSTTFGVVLTAGGGELTESVRDDLMLPTFQHFAVCAAAGTTLTVCQGTIQ